MPRQRASLRSSVVCVCVCVCCVCALPTCISAARRLPLVSSLRSRGFRALLRPTLLLLTAALLAATAQRADAAERKSECIAITKSLRALKATMEGIRGAQAAGGRGASGAWSDESDGAALGTPARGAAARAPPRTPSRAPARALALVRTPTRVRTPGGGGGGAEAITSQLFRGENLTMLLRHALTPSARNPSPKILMICCVAACRRWRRMTIDSLRFATECTQITLKSAAEQAVDRAQISEVQRLLRSVDAAQAALRAHLAVAQRALRGSGGAAAEERLTRWAEDAAALVARTRRVAEACDGKGDA